MNAFYTKPHRRSPWDRGSRGSAIKESTAAMMARLARKPDWRAPAIHESALCYNCDGAPDGGHTDDELCRRTLEAT